MFACLNKKFLEKNFFFRYEGNEHFYLYHFQAIKKTLYVII